MRDLNRYLQQRGPYSGFVLEAARKLGEFIEVEPLSTRESAGRMQNRDSRTASPIRKKSRRYSCNGTRVDLNSLPDAERRQIIDAFDKRQHEGSLEMSEGQEIFELIREANEWRVFLNWQAGVRIPLKLDLSKSPRLGRGAFPE